jgi:hypothetical protein
MRSFADPASMTPDERLSEVASIFAAGILRLHARAALSCDNSPPEKSQNSAPPGLELSDETVLSVNRG